MFNIDMSIYHVLVQHVKDTKKCISLLVFLNIVSICSIQNRFKSYLVFHYFVSKSTFKQKLNDLFLILVSNILFHLKKKKKNHIDELFFSNFCLWVEVVSLASGWKFISEIYFLLLKFDKSIIHYKNVIFGRFST